jgi:thioredoxin-like negative regulator of GroEL
MDRDDGEKLARQHGIIGTPTLLLLDREGRQVDVLRGTLPVSVIDQVVNDLVTR